MVQGDGFSSGNRRTTCAPATLATHSIVEFRNAPVSLHGAEHGWHRAVSMATTWTAIRTSSFVRSVGVLTGGIILAHAITALATPVATRLYSPADFSVLAALVALISIIGTASCLRFDMAVPIPEQHDDGATLLVMALVSCTTMSIVATIVVTVAPDLLATNLNQPALREYRWLLPIGVLLLGSYSALQAWLVRQKDFRSISQTRVAQSCAGASVQLGLGWLGVAPLGLMLGQIITSSGGALMMAVRSVRATSLSTVVSIARMRELLTIYQRFPTYSTLETLCNTGGMQIPVIMIAAWSTRAEAGYLLLAIFIMQAPMGLIGTSVSQVYLSRAPEEHRSGRLASFTVEVYRGLLNSGAGPLIFAGLVAPSVFAIIFGEEWRRAGTLVAWMTPWFVLQFLVVPISVALHVTNRLRTAFALQVGGLVIRVMMVLAAVRFLPAAVAESYAVSGFVFYFIYLVVVLRVVHASTRDVARMTVGSLPVLAAWTVAGIVAALAAAAAESFLRRTLLHFS